MRVSIRPLGNSSGIVILKSTLAQLGLKNEADLTVENDVLVIRKPALLPRAGWADAARAVALSCPGELLLGEFSNQVDADLER